MSYASVKSTLIVQWRNPRARWYHVSPSSAEWATLVISRADARPGTNTKGFVLIVVKIPLLQIFTLLIALLTILLELPVPLVSHLN